MGLHRELKYRDDEGTRHFLIHQANFCLHLVRKYCRDRLELEQHGMSVTDTRAKEKVLTKFEEAVALKTEEVLSTWGRTTNGATHFMGLSADGPSWDSVRFRSTVDGIQTRYSRTERRSTR